MFHKITSLATLPDFVMLVGFQSGEYKQFDLKPYIDKYPPFRSLKDMEERTLLRRKYLSNRFGRYRPTFQ